MVAEPRWAAAMTLAYSPIVACVALRTIGTAADAPTAAEPPPEMLPATTIRGIVSSEGTSRLPPALADALLPLAAAAVTETTAIAAVTRSAALAPKEPPPAIEPVDALEA